MAPATLAPASPAAPHFERRTAAVPEISGVREMVGLMNADGRPPRAVLADLRKGRSHFARLREAGEQTSNTLFNRDASRTQNLIKPILNSENARNPGLNAVGFRSGEEMTDFLRKFSTPIRDGQEGHVRCHVGFSDDGHRVAIDAFKHREGGFTLVAVDSGHFAFMCDGLSALERKHSDLIKGAVIIPTPNQAHNEGCRIFAVNTLNALHDYRPHVESLHREIHDLGKGKAAPRLSRPEWIREGEGNTFALDNKLDAFGVLPGKFFKHIQPLKPKPGQTYSLFDEAEYQNPALKDQPVNKKGQTLRERFASQNPAVPPEEFSRADRTASLDRKRLVLIDRAIGHYERMYGPNGDAQPPGRSLWIGNGWY